MPKINKINAVQIEFYTNPDTYILFLFYLDKKTSISYIKSFFFPFLIEKFDVVNTKTKKAPPLRMTI